MTRRLAIFEIHALRVEAELLGDRAVPVREQARCSNVRAVLAENVHVDFLPVPTWVFVVEVHDAVLVLVLRG